MKNPNLLIIQTDQQSRWTLSCYGENEINTPCIDSIANEGAMLTNFYTPSAVCTPSRGCFITGKYPHCNGAFRNNISINKNECTLAHILSEENYYTGYIGKWHLNGSDSPGWINYDDSMGFQDFKYMFNCSHQKNVVENKKGKPIFNMNIGENRYMTDWLTDKAIDFIDNNKSKNFFLMVSIPDPHTPYSVRKPYDTMFSTNDVKVPETFNEQKLPDWAECDEWGRKSTFPIDLTNREKRFRYIKSQYLGEVKCIDYNVGRLLDNLKINQILDDTIIVFTTDHGDYMGEHGMLYKNNLYESVYHIPFVIRWPKKINMGLKINEYITVVDFQQTILGLMGLKMSGQEQGKNASDLLKGIKIPWKNEVFIHPNDVPRTGIITEEFELAFVGTSWSDKNIEFKDHILFDRKNDPQQLNNLFNNVKYKDIIDMLTNRIIEHHKSLNTDVKVLPKYIQRKMMYL